MPTFFLRSLWRLGGIIFLAAAAFPATLSAQYSVPGRIVSIQDAENFVVSTKANDRSRLKVGGIDAPEKDQSFGPEAAAYVSALLNDRDVLAETIKVDSMGRRVSRITVDGKDLALLMIEAGLAWHSRDRSETSNADFDAYSAAESKARVARVGLWKDEKPVEPWEWRKRAQATLPPVQQSKASPISPPREILVGVVKTKLYYAFACREARFDPNVEQKGFYSEQEAKDAGYTKAPTCSESKPEIPKIESAAPLKTAKAIRIIQVTSSVEAYKRKLVTFEGEIQMSTYFTGEFYGKDAIAFSFRIRDGSDSVTGYTLKTSGASRLRALLLQREETAAWGKFRVLIYAGSTPSITYGELIDFILYD